MTAVRLWRRVVVAGTTVIGGCTLALASATTSYADAEVLVEHIEDYSSTYSTDLPGCADTAANMVDEFDDAGQWSRTWYADTLAWESDWKSSALTGGEDDNWSDDDDFSYFCGHGSTGSVQFTTQRPDDHLTSTEGNWGNEDVEWVTFDTSLTLRDSGSNVADWYSNGFDKVHLLVGWHDSPLDTDTGGEYADELIDHGAFDGGGDTVSTAWFANSGGCTGQSSGTTQNILAEVQSHYDDRIHFEGVAGVDQPNNGTGWTWLHDC